MMKHLLNSDRYCTIITQNGLGKRIPDENNFDFRLVHQARRRVVVSRQASDLLSSQLPFEDDGNRYFAHGLRILVHGITSNKVASGGWLVASRYPLPTNHCNRKTLSAAGSHSDAKREASGAREDLHLPG